MVPITPSGITKNSYESSWDKTFECPLAIITTQKLSETPKMPCMGFFHFPNFCGKGQKQPLRRL